MSEGARPEPYTVLRITQVWWWGLKEFGPRWSMTYRDRKGVEDKWVSAYAPDELGAFNYARKELARLKKKADNRRSKRNG